MKKEIFLTKRDNENNVILIISKIEGESNKFEIYLQAGITSLDKVEEIINDKKPKV